MSKFEYENFYSQPEKFGAKEILLGIGGGIMAMFSLWVLVVLAAVITN